MVMDLVEDVVVEILLRLPVRSLVRFRCVCKSWYTLLKSPDFINMHLTHQHTNCKESIFAKRYMYYSHEYFDKLPVYRDIESVTRLNTPPEYEFKQQVQHRDYGSFVGHSNGIVCMRAIGTTFFLLNLALRESRILPVIPWSLDRDWEYGSGFGFDETNKDYKIVVITKLKGLLLDDPTCLDVEIYNLSTNCWRKFGIPLDLSGSYLQSSIYFKGFIHWPEWPDCSYMQSRILTFNTTTEVFEAMPFPRGWEEYSPELVTPKLLLMDNTTIVLVAYTMDFDKFGWMMDVWVMKEYGVNESWAKLYSVPTPSPLPYIVKPLYFWKKDNLINVTSEKTLICYGSDQQYQIRQFAPEDFKDPSCHSFELFAFHESLISITNV